jgi:uncharacterized Ntn-hydrolase superfamily protein
MTYSIVARDPRTGELGVAVQSHYFSVGGTVPWLASGVGAVATQALVDPSYGPRGLQALGEGLDAPAALARCLAEDGERDVRQVAFVDRDGGCAVHTGPRCIGFAGHFAGDAFTVQANMMRREGVPEAMSAAFTAATGPLADRLVAALVAAEAAGGDVRGRQSAAVRVVAGTATGDAYRDTLCDLRVEDHPDPNAELARLVRLDRAYRMLSRSEDIRADAPEEAAELVAGALALAPDNVEIAFWTGLDRMAAGDEAGARDLLDRAFAADPGWRELVPRLVPAGLLPDDPALISRVLG